MTRQKRRVFVKGEFFPIDGHSMFNNKEITFKDKMVFVSVNSRAKTSEKADESFIRVKEFSEYFKLNSHTVSDSTVRLEKAGLAFREFKMKLSSKTNKEEKKWGNTWSIPGRFDLLEKGASKLLIDYSVLRSGSISPRAKMVYFFICYKSSNQDINGEIQERAKVSRKEISKGLGIKDDENLTAAIDELVEKGLLLRLHARKTTKYGTQVDTLTYIVMELPEWIKNGEYVAENATTATTEDNKDTDNKSVEVKKDSEAANNGVEVKNMALINTTESIIHNEQKASNNQNFSEDDFMSGFLGKFEHTPTIEERGGEDVDAFLKELDPKVEEYVEEYEQDEYIEEEAVDEEQVHIPSPTTKTTYTSILGQTVDEVVQEANKKVFDYQDNKRPTLTKEDVSFKTGEFDSLLKNLAGF